MNHRRSHRARLHVALTARLDRSECSLWLRDEVVVIAAEEFHRLKGSATGEALIAAIYLDGGLEPSRAFLMREFQPGIEAAKQPDYFGRDHKSRLQEQLQANGLPLPVYRVSGEIGPDHRKQFHVAVVVGDDVIAQGVGRTKKEAEQEGARLALEALGSR